VVVINICNLITITAAN